MLREIKTLILPTKSEYILYPALALFLLIAQNVGRYWSYFSGVSFEQVKNANSVGGQIEYWVLNAESKLDPRIADFFVWMLLGMVAISLVLFIQSNFRNANDERNLLEHMRSPKNKAHELEVFSLRIATQVAAFIGLLIYLRIFLGSINTSLTSLFLTSSLSLTDPASWLWLVVSIVAFAFSLYVFTLLARVMLLKARILN
jgi:hypothetical protein